MREIRRGLVTSSSRWSSSYRPESTDEVLKWLGNIDVTAGAQETKNRPTSSLDLQPLPSAFDTSRHVDFRAAQHLHRIHQLALGDSGRRCRHRGMQRAGCGRERSARLGVAPRCSTAWAHGEPKPLLRILQVPLAKARAASPADDSSSCLLVEVKPFSSPRPSRNPKPRRTFKHASQRLVEEAALQDQAFLPGRKAMSTRSKQTSAPSTHLPIRVLRLGILTALSAPLLAWWMVQHERFVPRLRVDGEDAMGRREGCTGCGREREEREGADGSELDRWLHPGQSGEALALPPGRIVAGARGGRSAPTTSRVSART